MTPNPTEPTSRLTQADDADLFDYGLLRDYAVYIRNSTRRHRMLFLGCATFTLLITVLLALALPKTFHTETRLSAQRNQVIAALGNPGRSIPGDYDAPTKGAQDLVMRRDNLVALIKQTNLIESWQATRAPLQRMKDWVFAFLRPQMTEELWIDSLVGTLEKRLYVNSEEGSVSIGIDWPDAQMAFRLVEAAQENFFDARLVQEQSTINEAISILQNRSTVLQGEVEEALAEMEKVRQTRRASATASAPRQPSEPSRSGPKVNEAEANQLRYLIESKRRAIEDLEEIRRRRLTELQSQLAEQKVMYSGKHPTVVDTEQRIAAMSRESSQISLLRKDEESLSSQLTAMIGKTPNDEIRPRRHTNVSAMDLLFAGDRIEDPVVQFAQDKLRIANAKYQDMLMRIESAKLELESSRAAFKFRYSVSRPAQVPRSPVKPNLPVILVAGVVAALGLALFACVARDISGGKVVEPWQVSRQLGLPVLAQLVKGHG